MKKLNWGYVMLAGTVLLGASIIAISWFADRKAWDRDTDLLAARHDTDRLVKELGEPPGAEALDFLEVETGPLRRDLNSIEEAWVVMTQSWRSPSGFEGMVAWHDGRLRELGWLETQPGEYAKGRWKITLSPDPSDATACRRRVEWNRGFLPAESEAPQPSQP